MSRVTVLLKCFTWLVIILRQLSKLVVGYSNPPWPTSQLCLPTLHPQCWIKETCNPGNCSHFTLLTWTQMSHCHVGQKSGWTVSCAHISTPWQPPPVSAAQCSSSLLLLHPRVWLWLPSWSWLSTYKRVFLKDEGRKMAFPSLCWLLTFLALFLN